MVEPGDKAPAFTLPDGRLWLLRRGFEPGKGLWTFPGGFVDLGRTCRLSRRALPNSQMTQLVIWGQEAIGASDALLLAG